MAFHHVALATRDLEATNRFYTEVMGFSLNKVVVAPTDSGGWAKHAFYDTGDGGLMAFWELHDDAIGTTFPTDLNKSLGLPAWVNHLAFDAKDLDDLEAKKQRWREHGITVAEVDHEWCTSIYATDPNGIMVEFCSTTRAFTTEEVASAPQLLAAPEPELEAPPQIKIFPPIPAPAPA
ncbi:MAG: hypothetical protein QOG64_1547 [Acidimicrobiaceae bacterium]|jgi:catechol 2,3-dioxygenase-like lactoylglutathione lyase family enzyme|nr:hypothetical protein [Acidimicrobiaceae bacterium]